MALWFVVIATLVGVNLTRLIGRGTCIACILVIIFSVLTITGVLPNEMIWEIAPALPAIPLTILIWDRIILRKDNRWMVFTGFVVVALLSIWTIESTKNNIAPETTSSMVWVASLLILAEPSTRVLRWGLALHSTPSFTNSTIKGRGELIGILERWISLVVLVKGEYGAMAFIIAAKTLARHKQFDDDPDFAEYFLVGTLASLLMAVAVAEAARYCLK